MQQINFSLNVGSNPRDKAIAEWLERQPRKAEAIKEAIEEKMAK